MLKSVTMGLAAACLLLVEPASAQTAQQQQNDQGQPQVSDGQGGRASRTRNREQARNIVTPEQARERAQAAIGTAGVQCQITEAKHLGQDANRNQGYEVVCSEGPGYIVIAATPPIIEDCLVRKALADATPAPAAQPTPPSPPQRGARGQNPGAQNPGAQNPGAQAPAAPAAEIPVCTFTSNLDPLRTITPMARAAALDCTPDSGRATGKTVDGAALYEVGCASSDGYLIAKGAGGWNITPCVIGIRDIPCTLTTTEEQAAWWKGRLAGTDAAACDVQRVRFMGQNPNGRYFENTCATGDGWLSRVQENRVTATWACSTDQARAIGGGCTLTRAAATPAGGRP